MREQLFMQLKRLSAEKKELLLRNKLLRDRVDLPMERTRAYVELMAQRCQMAALIRDTLGLDPQGPDPALNELRLLAAAILAAES